MATFMRSIFSADKGEGESNGSVILSRDGVCVFCGREVDRKQKRPNALLQRRADCGRGEP